MKQIDKLPCDEVFAELCKKFTDPKIAAMYGVERSCVAKKRRQLGIEPLWAFRKGKGEKFPSDAVFAELYKTMKSADIAKMYGVTPPAVSIHAKQLGLRKNGKFPSDEEFTEMYKKHTIRELCDMYDVARESVMYKAKVLGLVGDPDHPRQTKPMPSAEELKSLLPNHSVAEIAEMFNVSTTCVYKIARDAGLRTKNVDTREEFLELYKKHTYPEIAAIIGISESGVYYRARKFGLTREDYPLDAE